MQSYLTDLNELILKRTAGKRACDETFQFHAFLLVLGNSWEWTIWTVALVSALPHCHRSFGLMSCATGAGYRTAHAAQLSETAISSLQNWSPLLRDKDGIWEADAKGGFLAFVAPVILGPHAVHGDEGVCQQVGHRSLLGGLFCVWRQTIVRAKLGFTLEEMTWRARNAGTSHDRNVLIAPTTKRIW